MVMVMTALCYPEEERSAFIARLSPESTVAERATLRAQFWTDAVIDDAIKFGF